MFVEKVRGVRVVREVRVIDLAKMNASMIGGLHLDSLGKFAKYHFFAIYNSTFRAVTWAHLTILYWNLMS